MPIVPSRAGRVRELVGRLGSDRVAERDSAVARLTLLGPRVVEPLRAALADAPETARLATLEVLERLDDPRALPGILALVNDSSPAVAGRALELAAEHPDARSVDALAVALTRGPATQRRAAARGLARLHGAGLVEALDPLVDTLLDEKAPSRLRLAVLKAVLGLTPPLPRSTLRPLGRRLAASADPSLASRAEELLDPGPRPAAATPGKTEVVERLATGELSGTSARELAAALYEAGDPPLDRLREALDHAEAPGAIEALAVVLERVGGPPVIPALKRALTRLEESPAEAGDAAERLAARAAIHSSLATLDSRVALHDLREIIVLRPPGLMAGLLRSAAMIGDASLVPALARAATEDPALSGPCRDAYRAIARREKLRRSSAALRKVRGEHRAALEAFLAAPRPRR